MKLLNKTSKLLGTATLVLALSMLNINVKPKTTIQTDNDFTQYLDQLNLINEAHAAGTEIIGGADGKLPQHIRFMYFLINGAPNNTYPTGMSGPEGGFLGMIRGITGPKALGGGLKTAGYSACTDIPATGNASMTDTDGTFKMYFETPIKIIPTGYTGANGTTKFEKRVTVQHNGTTFMNIEFNCANTVGWMRMAMGDSGVSSGTLRHIEVYYDTQVSTNAKLELYMTNEPGVGSTNGNEYFVAKFQTMTSSTYKFWIIRSQNKTGAINGFRSAAYGDTSSKSINAFMMFESTTLDNTTTHHNDNGNITAAGGGDVQCINYTTPGTPVAGSGCGSLTLTDAGAPIIDAADGLSIKWAADTTNGLKNDMTALAQPANP